MRTAALDLGKVRVGLAVADELGALAHPRPHLDGRNLSKLLESLSALVTQEGIVRFLVGLPRTLDGGEGMAARRARRFARLLREKSGCEVQLVDEWLTTKEAASRLREQGLTSRQSRERVDSAAAAVLLQSWLDGRGSARDE